MLDRRAFMKGSLSLALGLPGAARALGAPAKSPAATAPDAVLVDRAPAGGAAFAARTRARGLAPLQFSSDAAGSWMRELEPRLRGGPVEIEGYTSAATLFCLALLARDYGARVVRRSATPDGVAWVISSKPPQRAALAPLPTSRRSAHA
jgi:hypothetical protein